MPGMPAAPPPCGLLLRNDNRSVRFSLFPQPHCYCVSRIRFEEMVDALSDRALVQSFTEKLGHKHVRHLLDLIPATRMSFHTHAQSAKFFDPSPHSGSSHANFARDLRSANYDHSVVGKQ